MSSRQLASRRLVIAVGMGLVGSMGVSLFSLGAWSRVLAYASGERLVATDGVQNIGSVVPFATKRLHFHVTNLAEKTVRIVGAKTTCGCTVVKNLPKDIPPSNTEQFEVRLKAPSEPSAVSGKIILLTTLRSQPTVILEYFGKVE